MYNLLIGRIDGSIPGNRILEATEPGIRSYVAPGNMLDISRLANLPTLIMPEIQDREMRQVARVGHISNMAPAGSDYLFQFIPSPAVPAIPATQIVTASASLRINSLEFNRTHWAVKDVDLYRVLRESVIGSIVGPEVFQLPISLPTEEDLVAVMMPFDARFNNVYATLRQAVIDSGMRCNRADDIWINDHIMDDVVNLIWRARAVISDFSSKNANVFYETGIAHTLGRQVIQITQSMEDVPFDLRAIRTITYLSNSEGLAALRSQVMERLAYLSTSRNVPRG